MKKTPFASAGIFFAMLLSLLLFPFRTVGSDLRPGWPASQYGIAFWHESQGLLSSRIRDIVQTREGYLWLATDGGLVRFDGASFTTFNVQTGSLKDNEVWALKEDNAGGLWIGTFGGGLTLLKNGRYTTFTTTDGLPDDVVRQIDEDPQGNIWIATSRGACRYSRGVFTTFTRKDCLSHDYVIKIRASSTQGVFAVAGNKLHRFADGKFTTYTTKDGLGSNRVVTIHEDEEGALWFGTRGGLSRYRDGRFFTYRARDGLLVDYVGAILEDKKGNFWFSCVQGIFSVSKSDFNDYAEGRIRQVTPAVYGVKDGLRTVTFGAGNQPNAGRTPDGKLLFCSIRGVTTFDPEHLSSNTLIPPVHIESIQINKQTVSPGHNVEVSPGVGEVEIHYTAPSFRAPEKVQFKYQLEGYDQEWVAAGTRRFAFYANLPAGKYKFRVIACIDDGVWNEVGDTFYFYLKPHFYHTGWFYLLNMLALLAIAAAAVHLRVRQLEAHKKELQEKVTEALAKVKILSGLLPICANCKKVRDDKGYWSQIECYIREHSETKITHGICPDCLKKLYPEFADQISAK